MKLDTKTMVDALCGEYLLGTLRGAARRRFERALAEEPRVALRLQNLQRIYTPRYTQMIEAQPSPQIWQRLERELALARYRTPWHRRATYWRGWAVAATLALVVALSMQFMRPAAESGPPPVEIAQLTGKAEVARVTAALSRDRRTLELRAARPLIAGPAQSYELWLLPAEGGSPVSLAVLGSLDARFALAAGHAARLRSGAKLAVSLEPAGGSPTGAPTGPVILVGAVAG